MTPIDLALLVLLVAAVVSIVAEWFTLPYTIALVITGLVAGNLHLLPPIHATYDVLLTFLILPLLFEGSLQLAPADLRAYGWMIGGLALPGTLIAALGIGATALLWHLPVRTALLLGAIAAAIDPVSVIALIREAQLDRRLGAILEGEAVLNDGVAIVLAGLVLNAGPHGPLAVGAQFVWLIGGGGLIGVLSGAGVCYVLGRIVRPLLEALGSLILATGAFIAAERLGASGVIAVVAAGIVFGSYGPQNLTPEGRQTLRTLWNVIAFLANSVLFLLIGLDVQGGLLLRHLWPILTIILAALGVRAITVYVCSTLCSRPGMQIPWGWRHVLVWGGLRGGVAIALVLGLPPGLPGREMVEAAVLGLVVFTLLGQGLTVKPLMRRMGLLR
jgi:CPA1 family monovalent cation:H+ antiporter